MECDSGNVLDVLDALKVVDTVLFLVSVAGIDEEGELVLTAALAQGLPSTVTALVDASTLPVKVHVTCTYSTISLFRPYIGIGSTGLAEMPD